MTRSNAAIFILVIAASTSPSFAQSPDTVEEIRVCASMTDRDTRLACFDNLGERVLREESADKTPAQEETTQPEVATATASDAQPLPDEPRNSEDPQYSGLITSCKKGRYGDWYFVFDDGQVWKEVNSRNLRFKECNFNATIMRDRFGHQMQIDGFEKTIRVKRSR